MGPPEMLKAERRGEGGGREGGERRGGGWDSSSSPMPRLCSLQRRWLSRREKLSGDKAHFGD